MIWNVLIASLALGNSLYDAGKFNEAAAAYEKIEPKTAHVYFNLGNALFRQEKFGLAVLNYERARQLAPRDPDVLANLRFARQRLGVEEPVPLLRRAVESRTIAEWGRYELVAVWVTVLGVAGCVWLPRVRAGMIVLTAVAGVVTVATAGALWAGQRALPAAVMVAGEAEARFAPASTATVHFKLPEGSRVSVREDRGMWWLVERADGQQGWIESERAALVAPARLLAGALR